MMTRDTTENESIVRFDDDGAIFVRSRAGTLRIDADGAVTITVFEPASDP